MRMIILVFVFVDMFILLEAIGFPHDHGSSWAVYGQAEGETEMTDWDIIKDQPDDGVIYVKPNKTYIMKHWRCSFLWCWGCTFSFKKRAGKAIKNRR